MLRQSSSLLAQGAAGGFGPSASPLSRLAAIAWRGAAGQAAPVDSPEGPALPPFDYQPPAYTGPPKEEVLALRKQHLSPGVSHERGGGADSRQPTIPPPLPGLAASNRLHLPPTAQPLLCPPSPLLLQPSSTTSRTPVRAAWGPG